MRVRVSLWGDGFYVVSYEKTRRGESIAKNDRVLSLEAIPEVVEPRVRAVRGELPAPAPPPITPATILGD